MLITKCESWQFWRGEEKKNIKVDIPLEAFVDKTESLVQQWIDEKPNINREERLRLALYRFRHAVTLAHAAKKLNIPAGKARSYHHHALLGVMGKVNYLAAVYTGEQYEFHIFAVLSMLYERFEKQYSVPHPKVDAMRGKE